METIQSGKLMIDGFQFTHYEWMPGERLLVVQSNRLHESIEYINAKKVKGVAIAPAFILKLILSSWLDLELRAMSPENLAARFLL